MSDSYPLLVVIQGAPGSGKTTLVRKLKEDFTCPIIGKDDIKELLFDTIAQSDREFSMLQGKVSFAMLYACAESFLQSGQSVIIEGAFHVKFARKDLRELLARTNARCLELYCHVDEEMRVRRFEERVIKGERHIAHLDSTITPFAGLDKYMQLSISDMIDVDMTEFRKEQYDTITTEIQQRLILKKEK